MYKVFPRGMVEPDPPLPDGWTVVTYKTRPNEYCYRNSVTGKEVRVRERPTEPPPTGLDLLRKPENATGWFGIVTRPS